MYRPDTIRCHRCDGTLFGEVDPNGVCPYCSAPVGRSIQIDRNRLGDIPHPHLTRWAFGLVVLIEIVQTLGFFLWISGAASRRGEPGDWHLMFTLALVPWLLARFAWVIVSFTLMSGRLFLPAIVGGSVNAAIALFVVLAQLPGDSDSTLSKVLGATSFAIPWLWMIALILDCIIGHCVARASGARFPVDLAFGFLAIIVPFIGLIFLLLFAGRASEGFAFGGWILYVMGVAAASGPLSLVRSIWVWRSLRAWHRTN